MASGTRHGWLRSVASWRTLAVLTLLAVVVGGGLGVFALRRAIEQRALQDAELSSKLITSLVVRRNVTTATVRQGRLTSAGTEDMDLDVAELVGRHELVGLEVWLVDRGAPG